ncbi:MAG: hypothetical protein E6R03_08105, partial [Hyphomicrobiaceae bacterium]
MKVGVTVEVRCPKGSVAFQSQVDCDDESLRHCRKELAPAQVWNWRLLEVPPERIAFLAIQSQYAVTVLINGTETLLEGQMTTDFGVIFARRGNETFGSLPFEGTLGQITVREESGKKNRVDIIFGEVPEPVEIAEPEDDGDQESDLVTDQMYLDE